MKIYLIGFMGSGKTTIGQLLAKKLEYAFLDTDKLIEEKIGKTVSQVFESEGEAHFRQLEKDILEEVLVQKNAVVSTGGGLACFHGNIDTLNRTGITIYLYLKSKVLSERLTQSEQHKRPLLKDNVSKEDLLGFIQGKLKERESFYFRSKLMIDGDETPEKIVENIISELPFLQS